MEVDEVPFKSKAQARYMFSQHPQMAKEWAEKTKSIKALPEKVKLKKKHRRKHRRALH
jgi:hypothetical protein